MQVQKWSALILPPIRKHILYLNHINKTCQPCFSTTTQPQSKSQAQKSNGPLHDVKVLDLTRVLAVQFLFADPLANESKIFPRDHFARRFLQTTEQMSSKLNSQARGSEP